MGFRICYVDESGGVEDPASKADATPLMVIAGVIFDQAQLAPLTREFLQVKRRFFPGKAPGAGQHLDHILAEVKGKDIRASLRSTNRDRRRHATGYLDHALRLVSRHDCKLIGRIWIKAPGTTLDPRSSYTYAIQDLARSFQNLLAESGDIGLMVCDARMQNQNAEVSHSIFTQKHQIAGDTLDRLVEAPVFGHSVNLVGLQVADLMASALLAPMAARTYCAGTFRGAHVDAHFDRIKDLFSERVRRLQHRYPGSNGRWRGGVVVSDAIGHQSGAALFEFPARVMP